MAEPGASPIGAGLTTASFERHRPEETVLYTTLQAHWKTFLEELEAEADTPALPAFVVAEVEAFLRCGILASLLLVMGLAILAGTGHWQQSLPLGLVTVIGVRLHPWSLLYVLWGSGMISKTLRIPKP